MYSLQMNFYQEKSDLWLDLQLQIFMTEVAEVAEAVPSITLLEIIKGAGFVYKSDGQPQNILCAFLISDL